ncbi:hypothetical protein DTW90_04360 [Neorhizobium sp. P12A]|nr:hypothetical protein DTW90_04360 [Neorhizobium sp. P12A]
MARLPRHQFSLSVWDVVVLRSESNVRPGLLADFVQQGDQGYVQGFSDFFEADLFGTIAGRGYKSSKSSKFLLSFIGMRRHLGYFTHNFQINSFTIAASVSSVRNIGVTPPVIIGVSAIQGQVLRDGQLPGLP